jgi:hypothetical protein
MDESTDIKPVDLAEPISPVEVQPVKTVVWLMWDGGAQYAETTTPDAWEKIGWRRVER